MEGVILTLIVAKEIAGGVVTFYNFGNVVSNLGCFRMDQIDEEALAAAVTEANCLGREDNWEMVDMDLQEDFQLALQDTEERKIVHLPNLDIQTECIFYDENE
jgi:hypothetical protein